MRDRYLGYKWALEEAGIEEVSSRVFLEPTMNPNMDDPYQEPTDLARKYLGRVQNDIDGVVCATDFLAYGMMRVAKERKLKIPKDLKVVGIDDFTAPTPEEAILTTYHIPYETVGQKAFDALSNRAIDKNHHVIEEQIRGQIVIRQSA